VRLILKDFQEDAVSHLISLAVRARSDVGQEPQTLTLAAPTGSGKTVIATRWMELLVEGNADHPPDDNATFLWITDQPELNEQTYRRIKAHSTTFTNDELRIVDASFDRDTFEPGTVTFLNIQKLGREKQWVTTGDHRRFTLWHTVNRTAAARPGSFWVVIDEAHRGMAEDKTERTQARTIVQKFIKGSEGEVAVVPLVLGISATPERFATLVAGTPRTSRAPVTINPDDVRDSGLLKDAITLYHPEEQQPSDLTLLRDAAALLLRYEKEWKEYSVEEKAPLVRPVLVVQVEDATKVQVSKSDISGAVAVIEDALGPLADPQLAHAFQEGAALTFGERVIRYIAPADIQDDTDLRVVLFKRTLTTGWDCPRAEVMMSFRRAIDKTLIAQLVGRMVRTPLARAVSASDFLNSVSLYLPYYDEKALEGVIEHLTEPDPEVGFPTRVQRGENLITLKRNSRVKAAFAAAETLPTIKVDKLSKQSYTRRLLRLGRLLAWDKLDTSAPKRFTTELVDVLLAERSKVASTKDFKRRVADAGTIDVRVVTVGYGESETRDEQRSQLAAVAANVDHAFAECGRKLGGGLHAAYLTAQADASGAPVAEIKLELYALLQDRTVIQRVEEAAAELFRAADQKHRATMNDLPDERRQLYRQVRRQAERPEPEDWDLPPSIDSPRNGGKARTKHLYSRSDGKFACSFNTWEERVIDAALADKSVVGWLRNEPRKLWSFSIAYKDGGEDHPMYPDLLVFRRAGGGILCDIYEPHALAYEDAVHKAKGLAEFARDHGEKFGRIELIAELKKGTFKHLRLDDTEVRDKVLGVDGADHLAELFKQAI